MSKSKNEENKVLSVKGIFNLEELSVEIDGESFELSELLKKYDGSDITINCRKKLEEEVK